MSLFDTYKEVKKSKVPDIVNKLGLKYDIFITDKDYEDLTLAKSVFKDSRVILHKTLKEFLSKEYEGYTLEKLKYYPKELPLQVLNILDEFYDKHDAIIEKNKDINHFYILAPSRGFNKSGLANPNKICIVYSYFNMYIEVWNGDIDLEDLTFKETFKGVFYNLWDNFIGMFDDFYIIKRSFYLNLLIILSILLTFVNLAFFNDAENIPSQVIAYGILNLVVIAASGIYFGINLCEKYIKPFKHLMFMIGYSAIINLIFLNYKWPKLEGTHNWESNQGNVKIKIYKDRPLRWERIKN